MLAILILVGVAYLALNFSEKSVSSSSRIDRSNSGLVSYKDTERRLAERGGCLFD